MNHKPSHAGPAKLDWVGGALPNTKCEAPVPALFRR